MPRTTISINATKLREYIAQNDFDAWKQFVNPELHSYFEEIRSELLKIQEYQEINQL